MLSRVARSGAARAGFATAAASSDASSPGVRGAFRTVVALGLAGATAFVVEDTLNDLALWRICRNRAAPVIDAHPRLRRSLGTPFRSEAWWNSSVTTRGRGNLASCVFLVDGARASCDVQVTMIRAPSRGVAAYLPNLARNLANPEAWRVSRMEAILPHEREAGLPGRVNLLQDPEPKGAVLDERRKGNRRRWLRWPRWLGGGRNER